MDTATAHRWEHRDRYNAHCLACGTWQQRRPDPHGARWFTEWRLPDGTYMDNYNGATTPPCSALMNPDVHTSTAPDALRAAALSYAAAGVPIVPLFEPVDGGCACGGNQCRHPGKHPRTPNGLTGASTNAATVAGWWERWPNANIGGRTGVMFDVCDVDGPAGIAAVTPLLGACHGVVPLVRTGSGGWHLLFQPTGLGNRVRFLPDTDWRGVGGYVVLPPSLHVTRHRYRLIRQVDDELPSAPSGLLAALSPLAATRTSAPPPVARRTGYGPAALAREAASVATAKKGTRNHTLNCAAFNLGQLIAAGQLTEADVTAELTAAALRAGLTGAETARTITSGFSAGQRHPRTTNPAGRAA